MLKVVIILYFLSLFAINLTKGKATSCNQDWRDIELMLPVNVNGMKHRLYEWRDIFLQTFLLFWPIEISNTKLMIMLDNEDKNNSFINEIEQEIKYHRILDQRSRIVFNDVNGVYYDNFGWKRQQYVMMYADNFTNAEFVGFVDTDCMFITYVHSSDIFENGKPVINGKSGNPYKPTQKEEPIWREIVQTTYDILGIKEPMKCMSYWPVVIRTKHIPLFRKFVEEKYQMPFYEVMRLHISKKWFGQFNMFCAYIFEFHRDEYTWYVHNISPGWDYSGAFGGMSTNHSIYSPEMFYPKQRVAIHARYHVPEIHFNSSQYHELLQIGTCVSPPFPKVNPIVKKHCDYYANDNDYQNKIFVDQYKFEKFNFYQAYERSELLKAQSDRWNIIKDCHHHLSHKQIQTTFEYPLLTDGEILYTDFTGAALFVYENKTLHGFANWGAFVGRGLESKPRRKISAALYYILTIGETYH